MTKDGNSMHASSCKLTFVSEPESVGEAERVVEGHVEEELPPDEPVDGALPPQQQLQGETAKGLAGGEHLTAVGQCHGHSEVTRQVGNRSMVTLRSLSKMIHQ